MKTERELSLERRARFEAAAKARDPKYVMPPDPFTDPANIPGHFHYRSQTDQRAFEQGVASAAQRIAAKARGET